MFNAADSQSGLAGGDNTITISVAPAAHTTRGRQGRPPVLGAIIDDAKLLSKLSTLCVGCTNATDRRQTDRRTDLR